MSPDTACRSSESFSSLPLRSSDDLRTQRMWEGVPPEVFERAPSTVGKFEQVETELVARLLAHHVALEGGAIHLLGCGTAFREVETLLQARAIEVERRLKVQDPVLSGDGPAFVVPRLKPINALIGYDFAAQFLEVAARRLSELAELGVTDSARTELCSLEQVELRDRRHGLALLGVYDVECLIGKALDGEESVGLEEYGCGMREILGAHIQLAPLIVEGDSLKDNRGNWWTPTLSRASRCGLPPKPQPILASQKSVRTARTPFRSLSNTPAAHEF